MPKILVTPAKGLFQESGSGTLSGHLHEIKSVDGTATLTLADSGKTILVGGAGGTIQFPVDNAGFHARFMITGSLEANVVLSGSAASSVSSVTLSAGLACGDGTVNGADVSGNTVRFLSAAATAGDTIEVEVPVAQSLIIARGNSNA